MLQQHLAFWPSTLVPAKSPAVSTTRKPLKKLPATAKPAGGGAFVCSASRLPLPGAISASFVSGVGVCGAAVPPMLGGML